VTYPCPCRGAVVATSYARILGKLALLVIPRPQLRPRFLDAYFLGASYLATRNGTNGRNSDSLTLPSITLVVSSAGFQWE
jgi:hypothetical protein